MNTEPSKIQTYVLKQLQSGLSTHDISEQLRAAGWAEADIQAAFTVAQAQLTPTPTVIGSMPQPAVDEQPTEPQPLGTPIESRGSIKTGWLLAKQSLSVIANNRELARYMIMSMLFSFVIVVGFAVIAIYDSYHDELLFSQGVDYQGETELVPTPAGFALLALVAFTTTFVTYYYATGLSSHVLGIFRGTPGSYADHMGTARKKASAIAAYALISVAVGFLLRLIEQKFKFIGRIVSRILGVAWELANSFTIPVIADSDRNGPEAIKQSASLFKANWGEAITGRVIISGLIFIVYFVVAIPLAIILAFMLGSTFGAAGVIAAVALLVIGIIAVGIFDSLATSILNTALYYYAQYKVIPPAFSPDLLASVFIEKKRKR